MLTRAGKSRAKSDGARGTQTSAPAVPVNGNVALIPNVLPDGGTATNVTNTALTADALPTTPGSAGVRVNRSRRTSHATSKSSATILAQQLTARAQHARRMADREAELERAATERERAVANLELQAQLALIEAAAVSTRESSLASMQSIHQWLENNEGALDAKMPGHPHGPQHYITAPANSEVMAAGPVLHHVLEQPAPVHFPIPTSHTHTQPIKLGTQKCYDECNTNKNIDKNRDTEHHNDLTKLAQVITNLAKKKSRVSDIKLPFFDGQAKDWLGLKRIFDETKGGFTNAENFSRLNSAIRGSAREAISILLVSAQEPEEVMAALELRFARPEYIVLQEIASVKALPKLPVEGTKELNQFACRVRNCMETMKLLNQHNYLASPELYNTIIGKLTPLLRSRWTDFAYSHTGDKSKLELIVDFLVREAELQIRFGLIPEPSVHRDGAKDKLRAQSDRTKDKVHSVCHQTSTSKSSSQSDSDGKCKYCQVGKHDVVMCKKFESLPIDEKWQWVTENKVCHKCLIRGKHSYRRCKTSCKVPNCKYSPHHNTLLHRQPEVSAHVEEQSSSASSTPTSSDAVEVVNHSSSDTESLRPLLKVVAVTVSGPLGSIDTYALLDDGSTATLIDSEITEIIGAQGPKSSITVDCIGGLSKTSEVNFVNISIKGRHSSETHVVENVRSISNLGIGRQSLDSDDIKKYSHLTDLTEYLCYNNAKPKLLIGTDNWHLTIAHSTRQGNRHQPVAILTALGWVLYGFASSRTVPIHFINHTTISDENESLEKLIKENYRLDSIGIKNNECRSASEERALNILDTTSHRLPSGRYETGLLWRSDVKSIPNSYDLAVSRFLSLEKKFKRDAMYAKAYIENIHSTIEKAYAEVCTDNRHEEGRTWYLPHFGVFHPQKQKLRVVHDAAAASGGVSLNDLLLPGPDLLQPLLAVLMRFREGLVAMTADIKEMFPQIKIIQKDRNAQRFLWRDNPSKPLKEYRMSSMIFGATSSPCTAIYIKNKNAEEHKIRYPEATHSIIHDHYMDDFLGSVDSVTQAAQLIADITKVHEAGCFIMRSWVSNRKEALCHLPPELCAKNVFKVDLGPSNGNVRVLGLTWNIMEDTLCFLPDLPENLPTELTKRSALSHLMKIYDPLGFLTPVIIWGRILFQQTWCLGIGWDSKLSDNVVEKWTSWYDNLKYLISTSIPRCYFIQNNPSERQLHVFADASEVAYACVAYWRFIYKDGRVTMSLIGGKARLAPLKPTSIPRLELQAALIAARFAVYVTDAHLIKPSKTYFWSDSLTVLKWLRSDARTFKPFVAHRAGEILESTDIANWRYVPSALNIADDATRAGHKLQISSRWFSGPPFLILQENSWPSEPSITISPTLEELKKKPDCSELVGLITNKQRKLPLPVAADPARFSSWLRLIRTTARALQYIRILRENSFSKLNIKALVSSENAFVNPLRTHVRNSLARRPLTSRHPRPPLTRTLDPLKLKPLTAQHLELAEKQVLRQCQEDTFAAEIYCLSSQQPILPHSKLHKLSPIIAEDGLLRLKGRIDAALSVPNEVKRPVILFGPHLSVQLLILYYHCKAAHANTETVVNQIRQKYWIIKLRSTLKKVAYNCQYCKIRKATPLEPPLGNLPMERLAHHHRPFSFVGLDYLGPMQVSIGRRLEKRYVALYTCLTTRAIHLEMVNSLSADSAIMSIRRFIARRGSPTRILSDNGTCFVGANTELAKIYAEAAANFSTNEGIEWKFIPPAAPFMGGAWERLVRSVKSALAITLKERHPKEETFTTLLAEVEALINSRPLTHISTEPMDSEALTPFHFLLGSASGAPLPLELTDRDLVGRNHYKKALRLADHFWTCWLDEYLPTIQERGQKQQKRTSATNLNVGDLVLVVDGTLPRGTWPRGKIVKLYPGKDHIVRVADVETVAGVLRRPAKKLVVLPV